MTDKSTVEDRVLRGEVDVIVWITGYWSQRSLVKRGKRRSRETGLLPTANCLLNIAWILEPYTFGLRSGSLEPGILKPVPCGLEPAALFLCLVDIDFI